MAHTAFIESNCKALNFHNLYRILHGKLSFWTAKDECKALGGRLLALDNVPQVMEALGSSMVGNVDSDFRIDGWSSGVWYEGSNNDTIPADNYTEHTVLSTLQHATLTVNLEDGGVSGNRHSGAHLGSVCQGPSGVGTENPSCDDTEESTTASDMSTTLSEITSPSDVSTFSVALTTISQAQSTNADNSGLCQKAGFVSATKDVAYKILDQNLGKADALLACIGASIGGNSLARVHTPEEREALFKIINGTRRSIVGYLSSFLISLLLATIGSQENYKAWVDVRISRPQSPTVTGPFFCSTSDIMLASYSGLASCDGLTTWSSNKQVP